MVSSPAPPRGSTGAPHARSLGGGAPRGTASPCGGGAVRSLGGVVGSTVVEAAVAEAAAAPSPRSMEPWRWKMPQERTVETKETCVWGRAGVMGKEGCAGG
jgi:hypothetical protein